MVAARLDEPDEMIDVVSQVRSLVRGESDGECVAASVLVVASVQCRLLSDMERSELRSILLAGREQARTGTPCREAIDRALTYLEEGNEWR